MFSTGVRRSLIARHYLRGDFGPESAPHSHPYEVEWMCSVRGLDPNGFGVDISVMESVLELTLHEIDDRLLNDLEYFSGRQPSLENLAVYLEETLRSRLKQQSPDVTLTESSVQIWESQTAWARYSFEETT